MASLSSSYEVINKDECDVSGGEGGNDVTIAMEIDDPSASSASKSAGGSLYPLLPQSTTDFSPQTVSKNTPPVPPRRKLPPPAPVGHTKKKTEPPEPRVTTRQQSSPQFPDPLGVLPEPAEATPEPEPEKEEGREFRILILGKTGNGKSSLGNTILGEKKFAVGRGMFSTTTAAQAETATVLGKRLKVVDTPDLTNLTTDHVTAQQHVTQWKHLTHPFPDVIILAVRSDVRYTQEEHAIYRQVRELWGDNSLFSQRLMVAFTFGDLQDDDLEQELKGVCEELKSVMREARNRYVQVNSRVKVEAERSRQLSEICDVLDKVIRENVRTQLPAKPRTVSSQESKKFALLVIGQTGHGKSSVANLIAGKHTFQTSTGLATVTKDAKAATVSFADTTFQVIDTPTLKGRDSAMIQKQISYWKTLAHGHRAVFLLVMRCDVRYTSEDLAFYRGIQTYWSKNPPSVTYQTIVVFTFKDRLDYDLERHVNKSPELSSLVGEGGDFWLKVNSKPLAARLRKVVNTEERREMIESLLEKLKRRDSEPEGILTSAVNTVTTTLSTLAGGVYNAYYQKRCDDKADNSDVTVTCQTPANQERAGDQFCTLV